jgi:hypothetical protein
MDVFSDSELFDDDAPRVSVPEMDGTADPLRVSSASASPLQHDAGVPRGVVYVVVVLAVLAVAALALHAGGSSSQRQPSHGMARRHHVRTHRSHRGSRPVNRRVVARVVVSPAADAPRVVVEPPSSGPVRPTGGEDVGIGRPTPAPPVGNTEQFGYLGK